MDHHLTQTGDAPVAAVDGRTFVPRRGPSVRLTYYCYWHSGRLGQAWRPHAASKKPARKERSSSLIRTTPCFRVHILAPSALKAAAENTPGDFHFHWYIVDGIFTIIPVRVSLLWRACAGPARAGPVPKGRTQQDKKPAFYCVVLDFGTVSGKSSHLRIATRCVIMQCLLR